MGLSAVISFVQQQHSVKKIFIIKTKNLCATEFGDKVEHLTKVLVEVDEEQAIVVWRIV